MGGDVGSDVDDGDDGDDGDDDVLGNIAEMLRMFVALHNDDAVEYRVLCLVCVEEMTRIVVHNMSFFIINTITSFRINQSSA
jgi:hypothetical protein